MTPWWSEQAAIWFGVIAGAGGGTLCGVLGSLMGVLIPRGIGKRFMVPACAALAGLGFVSLAAGVVAVVVGQPYPVYFPLVLTGAVLALVMGGLLPVVVQGYRRAEARKMQAQDLRRG